LKKINFIFFLFTATLLQAVPVGNPAEPALIPKGLVFEENPYLNLRLGYISNYVVKSRFKNQQGIEVNTGYFTYLGKVALNFFERADLYVLVGSTRGNSKQISTSNNSLVNIEVPSKLMISGGGGIKAILWEYKETTFIGFDGKYFRYYPSIDHMIVNGTPNSFGQTTLKSWQWEFSLALAQKFNYFIPYAGVSYLLSRLKPLPANQYIVNASERTNWGLFVGSTLTKGNTVSLNVEAKFFNQNEYGISAEFRY
jgi:hypothetical protein